MWREVFYENIEIIEQGLDRPICSAVYFLAQFIGEAENGGIEQYIYNDSGNNFFALLSMCSAIDCPKLTDLLIEIKETFAFTEEHAERASRNTQVESLESVADVDLFEPLEQSFIESQFDIETCIDKYYQMVKIELESMGEIIGQPR